MITKKFTAVRPNSTIGKTIGGNLYVHKSALDTLSLERQRYLQKALNYVPADILEKCDVLKLALNGTMVTFVFCKDFDSIPEPVIDGSVTVNLAKGTVTKRKTGNNPTIYHHKWLMVQDSYDGFNVSAAKKRSEFFMNAGLGYDSKKIGFLDYWEREILSKLDFPSLGIERYVYDNYEAINPFRGGWLKGKPYKEIKQLFPSLCCTSPLHDKATRHPTQVTNTVNTYKKIYEYLQKSKFNGKILDASSGLGLGTAVGREEFKFQVDDVEPFPNVNYNPLYRRYEDVEGKYNVIISSMVINVVPQDIRNNLIIEMANKLSNKGKIILTTRRSKEIAAISSRKPINENSAEYFIEGKSTYQKGFDKNELVSYVEDVFDCIDYKGFKIEDISSIGLTNTLGVVISRESTLKQMSLF